MLNTRVQHTTQGSGLKKRIRSLSGYEILIWVPMLENFLKITKREALERIRDEPFFEYDVDVVWKQIWIDRVIDI